MTVKLLRITVIDTWAFIGYCGNYKFEEGVIWKKKIVITYFEIYNTLYIPETTTFFLSKG